MAERKRLKRPAAKRQKPIRRYSTLFSVPTEERKSLDDVVARSVSLGYRIVDEYIRQGTKAAERVNSRSYGAETMASDLQDLSVRMLQYASDFAGVWLELAQMAATNGVMPIRPPAPANDAPRESSETPPPDSPRSEPSENPRAADATRVRIEIIATQPTEVSVDLQPDIGRLPVVVHALRAAEADKPRLTEVGFELGGGDRPARLRLRVPNGQPPGVYRGLIVEEQTSRPVGSVSVRVGAE